MTLKIAVNPKALVLIKERARAKLEFDGTYLTWLFRQELRAKGDQAETTT